MTASANSGSQDSTCSVAIFTPNESRLVFNNLNYRHTFILFLFFLLIGVFLLFIEIFLLVFVYLFIFAVAQTQSLGHKKKTHFTTQLVPTECYLKFYFAYKNFLCFSKTIFFCIWF